MHEEAAAAELDDGHAHVGGHVAAAQALLLLKAPHAPALHLQPRLRCDPGARRCEGNTSRLRHSSEPRMLPAPPVYRGSEAILISKRLSL